MLCKSRKTLMSLSIIRKQRVEQVECMSVVEVEQVECMTVVEGTVR